MEDVEYLEEYEDIVLPKISSEEGAYANEYMFEHSADVFLPYEPEANLLAAADNFSEISFGGNRDAAIENALEDFNEATFDMVNTSTEAGDKEEPERGQEQGDVSKEFDSKFSDVIITRTETIVSTEPTPEDAPSPQPSKSNIIKITATKSPVQGTPKFPDRVATESPEKNQENAISSSTQIEEEISNKSEEKFTNSESFNDDYSGPLTEDDMALLEQYSPFNASADDPEDIEEDKADEKIQSKEKSPPKKVSELIIRSNTLIRPADSEKSPPKNKTSEIVLKSKSTSDCAPSQSKQSAKQKPKQVDLVAPTSSNNNTRASKSISNKVEEKQENPLATRRPRTNLSTSSSSLNTTKSVEEARERKKSFEIVYTEDPLKTESNEILPTRDSKKHPKKERNRSVDSGKLEKVDNVKRKEVKGKINKNVKKTPVGNEKKESLEKWQPISTNRRTLSPRKPVAPPTREANPVTTRKSAANLHVDNPNEEKKASIHESKKNIAIRNSVQTKVTNSKSSTAEDKKEEVTLPRRTRKRDVSTETNTGKPNPTKNDQGTPVMKASKEKEETAPTARQAPEDKKPVPKPKLRTSSTILTADRDPLSSTPEKSKVTPVSKPNIKLPTRKLSKKVEEKNGKEYTQKDPMPEEKDEPVVEQRKRARLQRKSMLVEEPQNVVIDKVAEPPKIKGPRSRLMKVASAENISHDKQVSLCPMELRVILDKEFVKNYIKQKELNQTKTLEVAHDEGPVPPPEDVKKRRFRVKKTYELLKDEYQSNGDTLPARRMKRMHSLPSIPSGQEFSDKEKTNLPIKGSIKLRKGDSSITLNQPNDQLAPKMNKSFGSMDNLQQINKPTLGQLRAYGRKRRARDDAGALEDPPAHVNSKKTELSTPVGNASTAHTTKITVKLPNILKKSQPTPSTTSTLSSQDLKEKARNEMEGQKDNVVNQIPHSPPIRLDKQVPQPHFNDTTLNVKVAKERVGANKRKVLLAPVTTINTKRAKLASPREDVVSKLAKSANSTIQQSAMTPKQKPSQSVGADNIYNKIDSILHSEQMWNLREMRRELRINHMENSPLDPATLNSVHQFLEYYSSLNVLDSSCDGTNLVYDKQKNIVGYYRKADTLNPTTPPAKTVSTTSYATPKMMSSTSNPTSMIMSSTSHPTSIIMSTKSNTTSMIMSSNSTPSPSNSTPKIVSSTSIPSMPSSDPPLVVSSKSSEIHRRVINRRPSTIIGKTIVRRGPIVVTPTNPPPGATVAYRVTRNTLVQNVRSLKKTTQSNKTGPNIIASTTAENFSTLVKTSPLPVSEPVTVKTVPKLVFINATSAKSIPKTRVQTRRTRKIYRAECILPDRDEVDDTTEIKSEDEEAESIIGGN